MSTTLGRGAATVAVALLTVAALSSPAVADVRTFTDEAGDTGHSGDITTVKVANGSGGGHRIAVRADVGDLRDWDTFRIWLDTDPDAPGPEYSVSFIADNDPAMLETVENWVIGEELPCSGLRTEADPTGPDEVSMSVPRRCVGNPGKIRISMRAAFEDRENGDRDYAPGEESFFAWVKR